MDEYRFPEKSRVRLRDGIDPQFYNGLAKVGNEGVITGHRRDKLGFPEIYIKWDREHWAYNHQPDCWTYEDHFELVEEPEVDDKDKREMFQQAMSGFADQMAKLMGMADAEPQAEPKVEVQSDPEDDLPFANREERFNAQRDRAIELLKQEGTESFVVTAIRRRPHPDALEGELRAGVAHDSLSPEAELANGAQLAALAAQFHEAAAILQLYTIAEKKHGEHGKTDN